MMAQHIKLGHNRLTAATWDAQTFYGGFKLFLKLSWPRVYQPKLFKCYWQPWTYNAHQVGLKKKKKSVVQNIQDNLALDFNLTQLLWPWPWK